MRMKEEISKDKAGLKGSGIAVDEMLIIVRKRRPRQHGDEKYQGIVVVNGADSRMVKGK